MTGRLLWRASARSWGRHPLQLGLSILGVMLGVAVAVSVDLANQSALAAFRISNAAVTGAATHQIVGGTRGVPEELLPRLRADLDLRAAPVVEGWLTTPSGRTLRLLGIDPLAERDVRGYLAGSFAGGSVDIATLLTTQGAVVATAETATGLGLAPGDGLEVHVDGRPARVRLVGFLEIGSGLRREGLRDVLVADVSTAQEVLGRLGMLSRIDLLLAGGPSETLTGVLPPGVRLVDAAARSAATVDMSRAFRLNLTAMSLLAAVCGVFLIYNTMTFAVVRRRELIGLLRALGVTRREVLALVLGEALGIGVLGTVLGVGTGILLAGTMVRLVTRTLNDLYFTVAVRQVAVSAESLTAALLLGVGATLVAALAPAREATRALPRSVLQRSGIESRARTLARPLAGAGGALAGAGMALILWPGGGLAGSFAGLFALLLGASLCAPAATLGLARLLDPVLTRAAGVLGNLAARGVAANLSRTAVAVAALMVAVSVIIGVGTMVESFRRSLVDWLGYTLQADIYVGPVGQRGQDEVLELAPGDLDDLAADPRVAGISTIRRVEVESDRGPLRLLVVRPGPEGAAAYDILDGDGAWARLLAGDVLVSEPLATRLELRPGDRISVDAPVGERPLTVAGVFRSYASDRGVVLVDRHRYEALWGDTRISGLSLRLRDDADERAVREDVARRFAGRQQVSVVSNAELRRESLAVFDRTFLITGVLRALVTLVAFVGVFSALMAMALERGRELAVLRANGLTPAQLFGLLLGQTGVLGLIAGLLALPLGLVLAWVMIRIINRRAFGWSLQMHVPAQILLVALAVAVGAALLAGLVPALRRARTLPATALRQE